MRSGQNYKINKKIWELIEKQNNNGNENTEPEVPTEAESRDITFTATTEGNPMGANVPITVDGVTENTDENSQAVFNLVDGTHTAKIVMGTGEERTTFYYNDGIVTDAGHTEQGLNCTSKNLSIRFVDKDTQELIEDVNYLCEVTDVIAEVSMDIPLKTQSMRMSEIPYHFKVYSNDTKSVLLDEKSTDRDDLEVTFEIPAEPQVTT